MGDWHLGVRSNTREADAILRELLRAHLAPDVSAPPNYSLWLAERNGDRRGVRELHMLFRSWRKVTRARSTGRAVRALLHHLESHLPAPDDALAVRAHALLTARHEAVLVPWGLGMEDDHEPRLRRFGVNVVDSPRATIDLVSGEMLVRPSRLEVDEQVLAEVDAGDGSTPRRREWVAPGAYPIKAWLLPAAGDGGQFSTASAVAAAVGLVTNASTLGGRAMLEGLARTLRTARAVPVRSADPQAVLEVVEAVISR